MNQLLTLQRYCPGCGSELSAARVLGYNQLTWDDGKEYQKTPPTSYYKTWSKLTAKEKAAAVVFGYTGKTWDNASGKETQPTSADKSWAELSTCGEYLRAPSGIGRELCLRLAHFCLNFVR